MAKEATAEVHWHRTSTTVERHQRVAGSNVSTSLRVEEVTVWAAVREATEAPAEVCADLDLGAHVALLRSLEPEPTAPAGQRVRWTDRSTVIDAPAAALESV